jgi:hypothetical protein
VASRAPARATSIAGQWCRRRCRPPSKSATTATA